VPDVPVVLALLVHGDDGSLPEAKEAPTCVPARATTLLGDGGGGSGGQPGTVFVPADLTEDAFSRPGVFGSSGGSVLTGTTSAQVLGSPASVRSLVAWFDLEPPTGGERR
jgi:hypothetical protein